MLVFLWSFGVNLNLSKFYTEYWSKSRFNSGASKAWELSQKRNSSKTKPNQSFKLFFMHLTYIIISFFFSLLFIRTKIIKHKRSRRLKWWSRRIVVLDWQALRNFAASGFVIALKIVKGSLFINFSEFSLYRNG